MPQHHTVPQLYLRAFADEAGRIVLVHRDNPARSHPAVSSIFQVPKH